MRQKPTRLPYSCQAQFGMSGIGEPPAGGVSTVRGMVWVGSQSSTLVMTHTAMRAFFGSTSGLRLTIAEYTMRSPGNMPTDGLGKFSEGLLTTATAAALAALHLSHRERST